MQYVITYYYYFLWWNGLFVIFDKNLHSNFKLDWQFNSISLAPYQMLCLLFYREDYRVGNNVGICHVCFNVLFFLRAIRLLSSEMSEEQEGNIWNCMCALLTFRVSIHTQRQTLQTVDYSGSNSVIFRAQYLYKYTYCAQVTPLCSDNIRL